LAADAAQVQAVPAGQGLVLSGRSGLLTGAAGTDAYLVAAELPVGGEEAVVLVLVAAETRGLSVERLALYDGQRAVRLVFDQAPASRVLWRGTTQQLQALLQAPGDRAAIAHGAATVGMMQRAFEITLEYLKTRKQFGRPIASNQVIQHRLVDLLVEIEEARALLRAAAQAVDAAQDLGQAGRLVVAAQACIAQTARHVWKESVQLHGAIGMTQEYELGQYVKRLAAVPALHGSEHAHLERLAQRSLDAAP